MDKADVVNKLRDAVEKTEGHSARKWAAAHGVSSAYVSDVMLGKRDPGPAILVALGLYRYVDFRKIP
jgi:hypothetical protein